MPEETKSEQLHSIINDDLHEFMEELFEDEAYNTEIKMATTTDLQYAMERMEIAVKRLQEAEAT